MRMHMIAAQRSARNARISTTLVAGLHIWQHRNRGWVITAQDPNNGVNEEHLRYATHYVAHRAACDAAREMGA